MSIQNYLTKLNTLYITGNAREHAYRGDLQNLLHEMLPGVLVTNEPARVACGAPDYVLTRKDIPVGYIEAKDIGIDLNSKNLKEQFDRYRAGLPNIVFTDYLDFHFYRESVLTAKIAIGHIENGRVVPLPENFDQFELLVKNFAEAITQTIKSPTRLAEMMAGRAKYMADVIEKSLNSDDEREVQSNLKSQMLSFQNMLIHDIDNKAFADIYAQTIAYGMFAARYHDPTLPTFSREEAATLIPKSNPFLRKLFQDIAGYDLDERLAWIVDELVRIFLATDVASIMKNFGKSTKQEDPVVHFYETFLASYSPALRKARGVWYTPQPVVNFIVRAVDDILKTEFNLKDGLADTTKIKIKKKAVTKATADKRSKLKEVEEEVEVHKVQILDPATGTGTFLAEVVRHIHKKFEGQQGIWSKYVNKDLIPRLNGFELLMASYAMAHLKMDMLLTETGYKPEDDKRFKIYLTNSLEEASEQNIDLFSWLADEANQANAVKRDAPVMVILGNPPYSGISSNNGKWIASLIDDYKYVDGVHFNERKHWLNDDYVKFIRLGQHYIDKKGEGVLAFINPHGFLDNPTFRGMRWSLLKSFDKIYTIDLHGNNKKSEISPDGTVDQNVFDIMQGVSINLFIKKGNKKKDELAKIQHYDLFGRRISKYKFLAESSIREIPFKSLTPEKPHLFFVPKNNLGKEKYESGFSVNLLFFKNVTGIVTMGDNFIIAEEKNVLERRLVNFMDNPVTADQLNEEYGLGKNYAKWVLENKNKIELDVNKFAQIAYRIFDDRWTYYDGDLIWRWRITIMQHFVKGDNVGLDFCRQIVSDSYSHIFITDKIVDDSFVSNKSKERGYVFPLYLYPETNNQYSTQGQQTRVPNLNPEILKQIAAGLGLEFVPEKATEGEVCFANSADMLPEFRNTFAPIDLLDYIYAVLHSPSYREKYKEFLKIDFPRVPYPTDADKFWQLVKLGGELRQIHLLESPIVEKYITQFNIDGNNVVSKPRFQSSPLERGGGCVFINETQCFENVPEVAWNFYIGGYQPAQKWLKDRKERELSMEDIFHYQKIIMALTETSRIMGEIDKILI